MRLDRLIRSHIPTASQPLLLKLCRNKVIRLTPSSSGTDNIPAKQKVSVEYRVQRGDVIHLPAWLQNNSNSGVKSPAQPAAPIPPALLQALKSCIVHEDDHLIAVNKPSFLPVHAGTDHTLGLVDLLSQLHTGIRLIHRLDRLTSGIVLFAKTRTAAEAISQLLRDKSTTPHNPPAAFIHKTYMAVANGTPIQRAGTIDVPLAPSRFTDAAGNISDRIIAVREPSPHKHNSNVSAAITEYSVLQSAHNFSLLQLTPITGKKHQLRVHAAQVLHTPIVVSLLPLALALRCNFA